MEITAAVNHDRKKVLGRGLSSLIPAARGESSTATASSVGAAAEPGEVVREIPLDEIDASPYQTRTRVDDVALAELAASIRASGVLQPIVLRPSDDRFEIVAGHRRWMASRQAGKSTVPAVVRQLSNEQALEITIVENLQREDINALDQAVAFEKLANLCGYTQEQVAQRTGKDRATVANYLRLLKLPEAIKAMLRQDELTFGHAKALMPLESAEAQISMSQQVVREALSVRATEKQVYEFLHPAERVVEPKQVDPNVRAAERDLERSLGMRVRIVDRKGKGKVVIEYRSLEDFDRLIEALGQ